MESRLPNGTGGVLIIYADTLYNKGAIESKGSNVNIQKYSSSNRLGGGGASGGGSVNIFANYAKQVGNIESTGGTTSINTSGIAYYSLGGAGGSGSTTVTILKPYLNYTEKEIVLKEKENYQITTNPQEADLILINTCSVREKPEKKLFFKPFVFWIC